MEINEQRTCPDIAGRDVLELMQKQEEARRAAADLAMRSMSDEDIAYLTYQDVREELPPLPPKRPRRPRHYFAY